MSSVNAEYVAYELNGTGLPQVLFEHQNLMGSAAADADYIYRVSGRAVTRLRK